MLYSTSEEQILQEIRELEYLPAPNPILVQLVSMLSRKQSTFEQIQETIEQDTSLCSQILRMANSAYYGMRRGVNTIEKAIQLLGTDEIRNLAVILCLVHEFRASRLPADFDLRRYWIHNLLTACIARQIAAMTGEPAPEEAYLYGLLHDLGMLVMAISRPDGYRAIVRHSERNGVSMEEAEIALNIRHTAVGYAVAVYWNFPKPLCMVMGYHHSAVTAPRYRLECVTVALAEQMARFVMTRKAEPVELFRPESELMEVLGLSLGQIRQLLEQAQDHEDEVGEMAEIFLGQGG